MPDLLRASEIVQIAIQIERNGEAYYTTLVSSLKDERVKKLFQFLADEEKKHVSDFKHILEPVEKYQPHEVYLEEHENYMKALADSKVFTEDITGRELAEKMETEAEAINMALEFERESILFFTKMKRFIPESEHKIMDSVIKQEREHVKKLSDLYQMLRG